MLQPLRRLQRRCFYQERAVFFLQFLLREGIVETNPAKLVATPRLEKKLPQHLSIEEAIRFIETPDPETDLGKRDRAMLELMYALPEQQQGGKYVINEEIVEGKQHLFAIKPPERRRESA